MALYITNLFYATNAKPTVWVSFGTQVARTQFYPVMCPFPLFVAYSWHSTMPTPTPIRPTRLQSYVRQTLFPRNDPREDIRVSVGVGVVEFQLMRSQIGGQTDVIIVS